MRKIEYPETPEELDRAEAQAYRDGVEYSLFGVVDYVMFAGLSGKDYQRINKAFNKGANDVPYEMTYVSQIMARIPSVITIE